ncbi:hypothetical protein AO379_0348 [Moraxella catarrhalis]|nr:hypothetical protein AO379_0348 [Moraxella catarrhalis]
MPTAHHNPHIFYHTKKQQTWQSKIKDNVGRCVNKMSVDFARFL